MSFVGGADLGEGGGEGLAFAVALGVVGHYPADAMTRLSEGLGGS